MFEKYTEKARRVIFFARYEASQFGSPNIDTEHLLLGLLREDKALAHRFLRQTSAEEIRQQIENKTTIREKIPTSVDLPLSNECSRVLAHAAEEAEVLSHKHVGTEHLLLGLLREEKSFAAEILHQYGLRIAALREDIASPSHSAPQGEIAYPAESSDVLAQFTANLSRKAGEQEQPLIGRQVEMERLIQVLGRSIKQNPVLVGEQGVGKRAMVEGLARFIANGKAPSFMAEKSIVAVDIASIAARRAPVPEFFRAIQLAITGSQQTIFLMEEFYPLLVAPPANACLNAGELVKTMLLESKVQCICSATPQQYELAMQQHPWLESCFTSIEVPELTEVDSLAVLTSLRPRLEQFHGVTYADTALKYAVHYAKVFVKNRFLPDKAIDLADEAGAYVKAQMPAMPEEISKKRQEIRFTKQRIENAVSNHEFEKARYYSDQERTEQQELRALYKKHNIEDDARKTVTPEVVEEVLSRWTGARVTSIRQSKPAQ